jgi:hypothetical protein
MRYEEMVGTLRRERASSGPEGGARAQSAPLAVILVFAMVIAGSTLVVAVGGMAISETQSNLDTQRAENTMTQLDSQAALVALESSSTQRMELETQSNGGFSVENESGWANVSYESTASGDVKTVFNATMGAVVYENGEQQVAYQGGGVWKTDGGGSLMVSPPEVHYRDATLTMPLVLVRGDARLGKRAFFEHSNTTKHFPNESIDGEFRNPVEGGDMNLTIQSRYYEAWGEYFEQRADGEVDYDHANEQVTVELVPPFDESFDNVVATTAHGGITVNGGGSDPSPAEEGVSYPSVDSRIEDKIDECQSVPSPCSTLSGTPTTIDSPGTYFHDGDYSSQFTVDNPGENVTIVMNGVFDPDEVEITSVDSDHSVTVLVRNNFDFNVADVNANDGESDELSVLVHSDGVVDMGGNYEFWGLLYAPRSSCTFNGGGGAPNFNGGMVCETATINGNPSNEIDYDPTVTNTALDLSRDDVTRLNYLHVSTNQVNVTSGGS